MRRKKEIVTLDGPSGVGKSTISKRIAADLGYSYLDTGAMYRAVGYHLQLYNIDLEDPEAVAACLEGISLHLFPAENEDSNTGVLLNGKDISGEIRTPEMSMLASKISAFPVVRAKLTEMQRDIGRKGKVVAEGRDLGTVVFPDAMYKFFLDADVRERARRRVKQLGLDEDFLAQERILEMICKRDADDSKRSEAPLKKADDATLIDTTYLTIEEVCEKVLQKIKLS